MAGAGQDGIDPAELRRMVAMCFSATELRELADRLGAPSIPEGSATTEAARELVRHFERERTLPALLVRLRAERPLVEWPVPTPLDDSRFAPPGLRPEPAPGSLDSPGSLGSPGSLDSSGSLDSPGSLDAAPASFQRGGGLDGGPTIATPLRPPPATLLDEAGAVGSSRATGGAGAASAWVPPGHEPRPERASPARGLDPRILIAVSALTVAAAVVAYLAGRSSSTVTPTATAASGAPSARPRVVRRPGGPAGRAGEVLARSFASVARACEVDASTAPAAEIFARAYEQCGPATAQGRPSYPSSRTRPDRPAPDDAPGATTPPGGARARPPAERAGSTPARPDAPTPAAGCIDGCDGKHKGCRTACGPEPTSGSLYDAYQSCLGRCLTDASKCRRACN